MGALDASLDDLGSFCSRDFEPLHTRVCAGEGALQPLHRRDEAASSVSQPSNQPPFLLPHVSILICVFIIRGTVAGLTSLLFCRRRAKQSAFLAEK
jgi:hypothetical protein